MVLSEEDKTIVKACMEDKVRVLSGKQMSSQGNF